MIVKYNMNITLVCPFYYPNLIGGSEVSVKILADWLASNGFNVRVLSFDGRNKTDTIDGVKVIRYDAISSRALALALVYPVLMAMKKFEAVTDVYHVYGVYPSMGAGLYKILKGKRPVIATLNNYVGFCPILRASCSSCNKFQSRRKCLFEETSMTEKPLALAYAAIYPLLTSLAKRIDKYIALSSNVVKHYVDHDFDHNSMVTVPNFINIKNKKFNESKSTNGRFNILYVGPINKGKGVDVLIRAFAMLQTENINPHLTLVGSGKWVSYCRSLVKKLDIEDKVTFTGPVEHSKTQEIYANADAFVHPPRLDEPFGRSLMEAMSYGIPCVVSNTVAPELSNNATLVFRNEDSEALARQLNLLINDKDLYSRIRSNSIQVIKRYDIDWIGRKIADLYHELYRTGNSSQMILSSQINELTRSR
jgi:glycosyltransferase involved in cell wall biosynthesis